MKIAILHEMLIKLGGAEKVVENLTQLFPDADLYTLIHDKKKVGSIFPQEKIHPSCASLKSQKIYSYTKKQRLCLPFMSRSVESLDFSSYDTVIVSSSGFAHGLKTSTHTKTIIYYHAPARYMWDWAHEYRRDIGMNRAVKGFLYGSYMKNLRIWDYNAAQNNDVLLANSATTKSRIQKYFRRDSNVLYPPIETQRFAEQITPIKAHFKKDSYYIILSALTEFKKLDIALSAFAKIPGSRLIVIGDGEYRKNLEDIASGSENIYFAGAQYGKELVSLVQGSLGLIFPGEEDFGIVPIEVMAAGKPVFALNKGGLTETILAGKTGEFFDDAQGDDFIEKFEFFHKNNSGGKYKSSDCKNRAADYDRKVFEDKVLQLLAR